MAPAQKDTLRKLQAEAYLSVLRAVAASELDWVRRTFDEERQGEKNEGSATAIVFFLLRRRSSPPTALSPEWHSAGSRFPCSSRPLVDALPSERG